MPENILISPLLGKIKSPDSSHIKASFKESETLNKNSVTSLLMVDKSYIDATSTEEPNHYILKRNLIKDSKPLICTKELHTDTIIKIFNELLQKETATLEALDWKPNSINLGNKKVLGVYVVIFLIFNLVLLFGITTQIKGNKKDHKLAPIPKVEIVVEEIVIQKLNNKVFTVNPSTGKRNEIDKGQTIEELFKKK